MHEYIFEVQGMTCQKCVMRVTQGIHGADPGAEVEIDLERKEVAVLSQLDAEQIRQSIEHAGYTAVAA